MARSPYKHYSVYEHGTDRPIVIHGTVDECLKATNLTPQTFYSYVSKTKIGTANRRYDVYVDDEDEEGE